MFINSSPWKLIDADNKNSCSGIYRGFRKEIRDMEAKLRVDISHKLTLQIGEKIGRCNIREMAMFNVHNSKECHLINYRHTRVTLGSETGDQRMLTSCGRWCTVTINTMNKCKIDTIEHPQYFLEIVYSICYQVDLNSSESGYSKLHSSQSISQES